MSKTQRIYIPPVVRKYVFERDLYHCQSCGKNNLETNLAVDRIILLARGGQNDISNLQTLCTCNQQKSDRLDTRFRRHYDI